MYDHRSLINYADTSFQFVMLNNTSRVERVYLPSDDDSISDAISPPDGITMFGTNYMNLYVRVYM